MQHDDCAHLVNPRNTVCLRLGSSTTPSDFNLCAFHVELRSTGRAGAVQGNHFSSEEILAIGDALWDVDNLIALVVDHNICRPFSVAVSALLNFEPFRKF